MATANFSGIASGIDTEGLIKATLDSTRATRITPNTKKQTEIQEQSDALDEFKNKLVALNTSVQAFRVVNGGAVEKIANSSDDSVATATASATLSSGSYSLTVSQLAEPARIVFPDTAATTYEATDILFSAGGAVVFTFNKPVASADNTPASITVTNTTTVSQFVGLLNDDTEFSAYAEAAMVNIGTVDNPAYKIVITAKNTGAAAGVTDAITLNLGSTTATFSPALSGTVADYTVDGKDAMFTVSGISSSTISRPTNEITDVISGLTISLKDTGTAKITISVDAEATKAKVEEFIKNYNNLISYMQENNTVVRQENGKEVTNTYGPLAKTSLDENFLTLMRNQISSANAESGTIIKIFADLGITTNSATYNPTTKIGGGTLLLDSDGISSTLGKTFANALSTEPDSVSEILESFAEAVGNPTSGTIAQFANFNRLIDSALTSNKTQISDLDSRIAEAEKQLSRQEEMLRQRYARLESLIGGLQSKQATLSSALAGLK